MITGAITYNLLTVIRNKLLYTVPAYQDKLSRQYRFLFSFILKLVHNITQHLNRVRNQNILFSSKTYKYNLKKQLKTFKQKYLKRNIIKLNLKKKSIIHSLHVITETTDVNVSALKQECKVNQLPC